MHFVHAVAVNGLGTPLVENLSREQVWRGLLLRAERPTEFLPQLHGCLIVMRSEHTLFRELDFGSFVVRDRVRLEPMRRLSFETDADSNIPAGRLSIAIEESATQPLQLLFTYDIERIRHEDTQTEEHYDRLMQSAYVAADVDSVAMIRRFARSAER